MIEDRGAVLVIGLGIISAISALVLWSLLQRHASDQILESMRKATPPGQASTCRRCGGRQWRRRPWPWPSRLECAHCGYPGRTRRRGAW